MPSGGISTGSPSTYTLNGTCVPVSSISGMPPTAVDPPHIGLFVGVKVVPLSTGNGYANYIRKLTFGSGNIPMISLGVIDCAGSPLNGWIEVFYLKDVTPGTGANSKVVYTNRNSTDTANAAVKSIAIDTITYSRVDKITPNSLKMMIFSGASANIAIQSAKSKFAVAFFACSVPITGASSGNQRLVNNLGGSIGNAANGSVVDIAGDSSVQLTATNGSTGNWGFIGFSIDFIMSSNQDQYQTDYNQIGVSKSVLSLQSPSVASGRASADVDFSNYVDMTGLLTGFTITTSGTSQSGVLGVRSGLARIINSGIADMDYYLAQALWNTPANSDYVEVSFVPSDNFGCGVLLARCAGSIASTPTGVRATIFFQDDYFKSLLQTVNNIAVKIDILDSGNVVRNIAYSTNVPIINGGRYKLRCGMIVNGVLYPHRYQVLVNDVPIIFDNVAPGQNYVDDGSALATLGPSYRKTGFIESIKGGPGAGFTEAQPDLPIKYWGMQDQRDSPLVDPLGWTNLNIGSSTFAYDQGDMLLTVPHTASGESLHGYIHQNSLGSTFSIVLNMEHALAPLNAGLCGLFLRESSTGKIITFGPEIDTTTSTISQFLSILGWPNGTSVAGLVSYQTQTQGFLGIPSMPKWLKIDQDSTNRYYRYSENGKDYKILGQHAKGTGFTTAPNQFGVWGYNSLTVSGIIPTQPLHLRCKQLQVA